MKLLSLLLVTLICASACGFQLRGARLATAGVDNVYIEESKAPRLARAVKTQLQSSGNPLAESNKQAVYIISLSSETLRRNLLSVNAKTGKAEEYELVLTAEINIDKRDGTAPAKPEPLRITRDFIFDEDAAPGEFTEQGIIEEEMLQRGASQILRRLQIIASPPAK